MYFYVLKLESNKWYVGKTTNFEKRLKNHKALSTKCGSSWTSLYRVLDIVLLVESQEDIEKELTLEYMFNYGWENVRGAAWTACNLKLPPVPLFTRI